MYKEVKAMETKILSVSDGDLNTAAEILKGGGIVGIPTETVYGLGGNALDKGCVEKIFTAKGRPSDNPLIIHISDVAQWAPLVTAVPEEALALAERFWPGPLTVILPKSDLVPREICGKLSTVAVRMPNHRATLKLIDKCGFPLAAPSANLSGKPSPTKASHVYDDLKGKIEAIVDGGDCDVGVESTVISLAVYPPRIYRPGGITPEMLAEILGEVEIDESVFEALKEGQEVHSPGTMYRHYSPKGEVIMLKGSLSDFASYAEKKGDTETWALCFEGEENIIPIKCISYGEKDNPASQAKHIFDALRQTDKVGAKKVFVRYPEENGVGLAVFNRLARACAFKIIDLSEVQDG